MEEPIIPAPVSSVEGLFYRSPFLSMGEDQEKTDLLKNRIASLTKGWQSDLEEQKKHQSPTLFSMAYMARMKEGFCPKSAYEVATHALGNSKEEEQEEREEQEEELSDGDDAQELSF